MNKNIKQSGGTNTKVPSTLHNRTLGGKMKSENNALRTEAAFSLTFQSKVCSVRKRLDFSTSGQWDVVVETNGKQKSHIFDGIMICSGQYTEKYLPLQDFSGI